MTHAPLQIEALQVPGWRVPVSTDSGPSREGRPGLRFFPLLLVVFLGLGAGLAIVAPLSRGEIFFIAAMSAAFLLLPALAGNWRLSFFLLVVYLFFSGAINHLTGYHPLCHGLKFGLLGIVLLQWFTTTRILRRGEPRSLGTIRWLLLGLLALYGLQAFNSHWTSLENGLVGAGIGILSHVAPALFLFIAFDLFDSRREIAPALTTLCALSVVMAAGGVAQHLMGLDGYRYLVTVSRSFHTVFAREHLWDGAGNIYLKPISFAKDAGAASAFYILGIVAVVLLMNRRGASMRACAGLGVCIVVLSTAQFLTMIRSSVMVTSVFLLATAVATRRPVLLAALVLYAAGGTLTYSLAPGFFVQRFSVLESPLSASLQHRGGHVEAAVTALASYPLGTGGGRIGPGTRYLHDGGPGQPGENYYASVVYELGFPGLFLVIALCLLIVRDGTTFQSRIVDEDLKLIGRVLLLIVCTFLLLGFSGPVLYSTPTNAFFWFAVGLLYRLPILDSRWRARGLDLDAGGGSPAAAERPLARPARARHDEAAGGRVRLALEAAGR